VNEPAPWDVAVVGAGAAGLATAIFAARARPGLRVVCLDGAARIGAKILVSGGSRCNVTNRTVSEHDFWGGPSRVVRHILRAFPAPRAVRFFEELGIALHEEDDGKIFPDTNRARTVLDALIAEASRVGVVVRAGARVTTVTGTALESTALESTVPFVIGLASGDAVRSARVVLATGGRSLPKTGSDGAGYDLARTLGHSLVQTTPGLAPLVLDGDRHAGLAGRAHAATLTLRMNDRATIALSGPMLWTHFGISGPVALNLSRHWHAAVLAAPGPGSVRVSLSVLPGETAQSVEAWLHAQLLERPRAQVSTVLATRLPAAVAERWSVEAGIVAETTLSHLARAERRRLIEALVNTPLAVRDSRGYNYAEVTAGGVPLEEIDHRTMASRFCPGLHLVGEILDVDGRLGGFNFQWAWSTAWVAGQALAGHDPEGARL
jgi:predicted Rossmann fold flavoprotein